MLSVLHQLEILKMLFIALTIISPIFVFEIEGTEIMKAVKNSFSSENDEIPSSIIKKVIHLIVELAHQEIYL